MADDLEKILIITTQVNVVPPLKNQFIDWTSKLNSIIAGFPGFVSLEVLSPTDPSTQKWSIIQKFSNSESVNHWRQSESRRSLIEELTHLLGNSEAINIEEVESRLSQQLGGVTEVILTHVSPGMETAYREWFAKIHKMEAKFPGFRGVYLQSPSKGQENNWITLLEFDNQTHLDAWLSSPEREKILHESTVFVSSFEAHRVISPYAGWFGSLAKQSDIPPTWKQTMIVLLVLFPIIMLELKFLSPLTHELNKSVATFIGNAISVILLAWPFVPIAIRCLTWWLSPKGAHQQLLTILGTIVVLLLYGIEIFLFWRLV